MSKSSIFKGVYYWSFSYNSKIVQVQCMFSLIQFLTQIFRNRRWLLYKHFIYLFLNVYLFNSIIDSDLVNYRRMGRLMEQMEVFQIRRSYHYRSWEYIPSPSQTSPQAESWGPRQELGNLRRYTVPNRSIQADHASDTGPEERRHAWAALGRNQDQYSEIVWAR